MNSGKRAFIVFWRWWPWALIFGVGPLLTWLGVPGWAVVSFVWSGVLGWGVGTGGGWSRGYDDAEEVIDRMLGDKR